MYMQHLVAEHCSRKYDGRQEVNSTLLVSGGLFSMRLINGRLKGRGILQCLLLNDETEASTVIHGSLEHRGQWTK
jgi:hypothetical protein